MLRTLLIEDNAAARADLRDRLSAHPEVAIAAEAATVAAARSLLARDDYDLVFLDVRLRGGDAFDLVPAVRPAARIIFVTAHDEYAVRAFEVNALDYLLKPVRAERLAAALRRLQEAVPPATAALRADDLVQVRTGPGAARFVDVAGIILVRSQDNYSELFLAGGEHLLTRQTLSAWEDRLPASHFLRVHRQSIINLKCIAGYEHLDSEITLVRLTGMADGVRTRRQHWPELTQRLAALGRKL